MWLKDPVLLGRGQPGIQRQDLGTRQFQRVQCIPGVADLPLAGQEYQDVAGAPAAQFRHRVADRLGLVAIVGAIHSVGTVTDLNRVGTAGDLDHRGTVEVPGEPLGVDGRRGDDQS